MKQMLAEIRRRGWTVAVHNDYRLDDVAFTFWLFTHKSGQWVKGEALTDEQALSDALVAIDSVQSDAEKIANLEAEVDRLNAQLVDVIESAQVNRTLQLEVERDTLRATLANIEVALIHHPVVGLSAMGRPEVSEPGGFRSCADSYVEAASNLGETFTESS